MSNDAIDELRVVASALTDPGCVRPHNEDSALFIRPADPEALAKKGVLALVADGMGGHQAGEVASAEATETIRRVYYRSDADPEAALEEAFHEANRAIHRRAEDDGELTGMGTTCTAVVIRRDRAHAAHVGDSRLYLLRDGELAQMTEDHSQVADMVRRGELTGEEARTHSDRNVITRALGTAPEVEVQAWRRPFPLRAGDRLLLSTDGLHDALARSAIHALIAVGDVHVAAERLMTAAKNAGGSDNISLVVVDLDDGSEPEPAPAATRKVQIPK